MVTSVGAGAVGTSFVAAEDSVEASVVDGAVEASVSEGSGAVVVVSAVVATVVSSEMEVTEDVSGAGVLHPARTREVVTKARGNIFKRCFLMIRSPYCVNL